MSTQRFVRSARGEDVETVVAIQVAAWRDLYGDLLPAPVLAELTGEEAGARFREQWHTAVERPPSSRHRLLVATDDRAVVGFAAVGPAEDPDRWPGTDAEIYALHVHRDHVGRGHGSRLLNAAVDHLLEDGFRTVHVWVLEAGNPLRAFVEAAGWRPDGARRELDLGVPVPMVRLHAAIGG
ncbi:GNAT family N-acetyltransferase [Marinitenerispora sediminis]|uniref:GNAT family N-acetyltransferase n=1 Tax=Marinitenerispora sediminis TaxID=1931232 RepID=A0A368T3A0_9ACTN|nr:GNAT family N-acetyltransferase [Marinitenerispora sediminis]RCV52180.1 GNAT family N-acetyltransferase [Marinitenerispora sediminis]RCV53103.1 GNAT family N-acetyltransferase [Marinitenerispora sediminis]RCV56222.1 GNAT family N-acetyltransferase [Marinitenerispora sediminis]